MESNVKRFLFIAVAFLLGSINVLYQSVFYAVLVIALLLNVVRDWSGFRAGVREQWKYLVLPLVGTVYIAVHYVIALCFGGMPYKVSWSSVELLLMYFFVIPLYVVSVRSFVTPRLLKQFLLALCWGVLVFNTAKLFCVTGTTLFTAPGEALRTVYTGRFGGNMELLGGFVLLEAQSLYLAITGIIAWFFLLQAMRARKWGGTAWSSVVIFIFSLLFLSFTVTKGSILAFAVSFLLLTAVYFRTFSLRSRCIGVGVLLLLLLGAWWGMPKAFQDRLDQMKTEIEKVQDGEIKGGTVAPRIALWKEDFARFNEWGLVGIGVYKKFGVRQWYQQSQYTFIAELRNTHNTFLDFWILGGIPGLLFILYYFFAPVLRMRRKRQYAYLIIALLLAMFIANNTCLLIALRDTNPLMIFLFAMPFLLFDRFYALEQEGKK